MRQIFLDTETTGFGHATGDRIVEIACVEMRDRRLTGSNKHFYLNPQRDMPEAAFNVHGLSAAFLSDTPLFADVVDDLLEYLAGAEIVIHNAEFDVAFLSMELQRLGRAHFPSFVGRITDTLAMAKELFPGKRNSLDALCDRLEVDNSARTLHGALLDAELLADVYINMTRGQETLLIDSGPSAGDEGSVVTIDLRSFVLPILYANPQELEAHADVIAQIGKASGGRTVWQEATSAVA